MTSGNPSWSVNGEYATKKELEHMEQQAFHLLSNFPAEYHRHYGYLTGDGSSMVLFSTHLYEEEDTAGSIASVVLESQADDEVMFEISYDADNQPSHIYYISDAILPDCIRALQRFIDEEQIPEPDISVLRFMQSVAFCIMAASTPEELALLPDQSHNRTAQYVADVIRNQVLKNTNGALRTKVWGLPLDSADSTLTIASNEILGELAESEETAFIPSLRIEYEDKNSQGIRYIYSKYKTGERELFTSQPGEDELDETLEDELADFRDSIGAAIPGRRDVKLLSSILTKAVVLELPSN